MAEPKPKETPVCHRCQAKRTDPCGLMACVLRKPLTADIPSGLTYGGRIYTRTRERDE